MKLKIKYTARNNCYISLPESFISSQNFSLDYTKGQISRVVQVKNLAGNKVYLSYNGGISSENGILEISQVFGQCLDLEEGDLIEARIENTNQMTKDIDLYCDKLEEYQLITINRNALEMGLLNQISVLFDGVKFPVYYNAHNYVLLTYKSKAKASYSGIATDGKLSIFCLEEEKKEENGVMDNHQNGPNGVHAPVEKADFRIKIRRESPADFTAENYLYIDTETALKYGLKEERLYRIYVKNNFWRKKEKSFSKFVRFYKKFGNNTKNTAEYPNPKKLDYSFLSYLKIEQNLDNNDENEEDFGPSPNNLWLYPSKKLAKRLSRQDPIQINPAEVHKDISGTKLIDIKDFYLLQKLSIVVYVIYSESGSDGESIRKKVLEQVEENLFHAKGELLLISNQLFCIGENVCLLKVLERTPEKKFVEIELLKLTNLNQRGKPESVESPDKKESNLLEEIIEVKTDVKLEELGVPSKKIEKMLKKYGSALEKKDCESGEYDFYQQEFQKGLTLFPKTPEKSTVLMISGPKRSGKTTFIKHLKRTMTDYYWSCIDFKEFISAEKDIERFSLPLVKKFIEYKFEAFSLRDQGIMAFDNVHVLCKHLERIDAMNSHEIIISESLASFIAAKIKMFEKNGRPFHFVFTSEGESFINERMKKKITEHIQLKSIDIIEKKNFIKKIFDRQGIEAPQRDIEEIVELTEYMSLNAFILLRKKVDSAISFQKGVTYEELDENILIGIIRKSIKEITASGSKNVKTELAFKDIGGLNQVKEVIRETFYNPLKYAFVFKNVATKLPRGILLYGPSGCGKTLIAAGASVELKMNFLSVKGPELLNKYIGASEQAVRDIFEKASAQTPCIIFFDEFDSIVPRRNSGSTGVTDRVVNQFLTYLDGVTEVKDVFILAATSRPDLIDPALLRPGRIDKHVYCGYPNEKEREEILKIYMKNVETEDVDLEHVAKESEGFSGADIAALVKNAQIKAVHNFMEEAKSDPNKPKPKELIVSKELFDQAWIEIRKTADPNNNQKAFKLYSNFVNKGGDVSKQKQTLY